MQDARLDALRDFPGKLRDPAAAAEIGSPGMLMSLWNRVLSLLGDPSAPVRQAAAPVVGCVGALASKQSSRAGDDAARWHNMAFMTWHAACMLLCMSGYTSP